MFYSFGFLRGLPPSSQINYTWRLILSYECPGLAYFQPAFLKLFQLPLVSRLLSFSISVYLSLLLSPWLAVQLGDWSLMSSSPCSLAPPLPDFSFYLFSLPASLAYPCSCLAIGRSALYQDHQVFQTGTAAQLHRTKQMQRKQKSHT